MDTGGEPTDAARALADVDAIRRRVVNVVGHALRTPVTTVAGMAAALESATDDDTRSMLIAGLSRNADRVESLLDELLVAAGVSTALPVGEPERVAVEPIVRDTWQSLEGPDGLAVDAPAAPFVRARAFERIVRMILDNALKYGDGNVAVRAEAIANGVRLEVESSGPVPSDEELAHACELLYRGEQAVMTSPGLGIGLAVARELARAEGGDVTLGRRGDNVVATVDLPG